MSDQYDDLSGVDNETPNQPARAFEDLSLLEAFRIFTRQPVTTIVALWKTLRQPTGNASDNSPIFYVAQVEGDDGFGVWLRGVWAQIRQQLPFIGVLLFALLGSLTLVSSHGAEDDGNLWSGGRLLLLAMIGIGLIVARSWTMNRIPPLEPTPPATSTIGFASQLTPTSSTFDKVMGRYGLRIALFMVAILWTLGSWEFSSNNHFTGIGVFCWILSTLTLAAALMDREIPIATWLSDWLRGVRRVFTGTFTVRFSWTLAVMILILIIGANFRFSNISTVPPEMTSDHVEKLLDSVKIYNGMRPIFLPNNGGREVFQMYYLAALKVVTGLPFDYILLKIGTGIEGMITILLAFWMGRALLEDEDPALGNLTGVIMAAMIATSYWHTLLSRLGLRIVTTTLVATVVFVYFARALRHNRRTDYLITGFALGAGMYFYQAVRMLPLVIIVGLIVALILRARSWVVARQYVTNFIALVLISFVVFIPLFHYSVENPGFFWERTSGRIFGDSIYIDPNTGQIVNVPWDQQLAAFQKNVPVFGDNMWRSMLMFNWKGDSSWFNGSPEGIPAMDFFTGAMFVLGLGILIVRIIRRRDPVDALLPLAILIMLLPSALALFYTIEVPGFTRASGALPMAYFVAALGLAVVVRLIALRFPRGRVRQGIYGILVVLMIVGAFNNANSYFVEAMVDYRNSTLPHHQAGEILRGFINSTGAPGNAVILSYKYWMDHRAIGIEAGDLNWKNTIPDTTNLPDRITGLFIENIGTPYAMKPDRQLLFFVAQEDQPSMDALKVMFPKGELIRQQSYNVTRDFYTFVVPPVGCAWSYAHLNGPTRECPELPASDSGSPSSLSDSSTLVPPTPTSVP